MAHEVKASEQAEHGDAEIRAQVRGVEELHCPPGEHRTDERGGQAAGQHEGDGAASELGKRRLGRGEAVLLGEGHGDTEEERRRGEQPEVIVGQGDRADQAAGRRAQRAHHEAQPAAHALHQQRSGDRAEGGADYGHRRRQRGQGLVAGQGVAGEAADSGDERHRS